MRTLVSVSGPVKSFERAPIIRAVNDLSRLEDRLVTERKTIGLAALACAAMVGHAHAGDIGIYGTAGTVGFGGGLAAGLAMGLW